MGNNNQSKIDQIQLLEGRFDALRVYGDERDFEIFETKESNNEQNCEVPIRAAFLYPELKTDPLNKRLLSVECVENALIEFRTASELDEQTVNKVMRSYKRVLPHLVNIDYYMKRRSAEGKK